jgi:hypothetical protein
MSGAAGVEEGENADTQGTGIKLENLDTHRSMHLGWVSTSSWAGSRIGGGMVYTLVPLSYQLSGLLEVVPQALPLSLLLYYWVSHPEKKWINWARGVPFILVVAFPLLGLFAQYR